MLSANTQYYFEMYVRLEDSDSSANAISTYATNNQGAKFTNSCFCSNNNFSNGIASAGGSSGSENSSKIVSAQWTKISGCFTANGDEKFVTIGNFESDNQTSKQEILKNQGYVYANYRVDDVALYELAVKIPNDTAICAGDSIYVDATLNNFTAHYDWSDGSTQPIRYLKNAGIYKLKTTLEGGCKPIEKQVELKFLPTRADWTSKDTTFCIGDKFVLRAVKDSAGTKLLWSDGSVNPEITITLSGVYWVRLKNNCIVHTDTINVKSLDCTVKAYIPNAFSPNGDGVNDVFYPFIYAIQPVTFYKFDVFDKWGNHVFLSENMTDKWDGKYQDHDCDPGIYAWQLQFKVNQSGVDVPYLYSGDVTLVK